MAFLCPSRLGNASRPRSKGKEPGRRGRITGSDSIDTVDLVGLEALINQSRRHREKENYLLDDESCTKIRSTKKSNHGDFCELPGNKKRKPEIFQTDYVTDISRTNSISSSRLSEYSADLSEANSAVDSIISRNMSPLFKPRRTEEKVISNADAEVKQFYKTSHGQYIVLFNFEGSNENDVDVERAELVEVLNIEDPDWSWVRKYDGMEGFVPKTYICPVEPLRKLVNGGSIQRKQNNRYHNYSHGYNHLDSSFISQSSASTSLCSESLSTVLKKTSPYTSMNNVGKYEHKPSRNNQQNLKEHEKFNHPSISHNGIQEKTWGNEMVISRAEAIYLTPTTENDYNTSIPTVEVEYKASTPTLSDSIRVCHLLKAPVKSPSCSTLNTSQASRPPSSISDFLKHTDDSNQSSERSLTDVTVISDSEKLSCNEKLGNVECKHNDSIVPGHNENQSVGDGSRRSDVTTEQPYPVKNTDPFKDVTEELALILKKRKQMIDGNTPITTENGTNSHYAARHKNFDRNKTIEPPDYETAVKKRDSSAKFSDITPNHSTTREHDKRNQLAMNDLVEYIMKYEYKGQSHGQQNVYLQKGEAIYANIKNQNSSEWIWVYIPRTEQYGYIPASYAEQQKTIVL